MKFIYNENRQIAEIEFTDKELDTGVPAAMFNFLTTQNSNFAECEKTRYAEMTKQQKQYLDTQMFVFSANCLPQSN